MEKTKRSKTSIFLISAYAGVVSAIIAVIMFALWLFANDNSLGENNDNEIVKSSHQLSADTIINKHTRDASSQKLISQQQGILPNPKKQPKSKLLFITSIPSGAEVFINDKFVGKTNMKYLANSDNVRIKLTNSNFDTIKDVIFFEAHASVDTIIKSYTFK